MIISSFHEGIFKVSIPNGEDYTHSHCHTELIYCLTEGYTLIHNQRFQYFFGDTIIHGINEIHWDSVDLPGKHLCLGVNGKELTGLYDGVIKQDALNKQLFFDIYEEIKFQKPFYKSMIEVKAEEIIIHLKRIQTESKQYPCYIKDNDKLTQEIKSFIDCHYNDRIDLESLKSTTYLSKEYISKMFKETYNVTPIQYLIQKRIEISKRLLDQTNKKIKEIANLCGFENEYYFCRIFKKITNLTPTEYKNIVYGNRKVQQKCL